MTRRVGIDEAGYGPNLGPLVMTAVSAEGPDDPPPDVWRDLSATVARAGDRSGRLWVDDSKAILHGGHGRDRLEAACLAALAASGRALPCTLGALLAGLDAGTLADAELGPWLEGDRAFPSPETRALLGRSDVLNALVGAPWRILGVRTVVVGPARFNAGLAVTGSKATVHFAAFARLLRGVWDEGTTTTRVRADKHGGRHYYFEPLSQVFPDLWIDRGPEGPALSRYTLRDPSRRLELSLLPRADAEDGLVALASIVSKTVRECWMDVFNSYWAARIPGLKPTAGYPNDARRFRQAIEADCQARGLVLDQWWRAK